MSRIWQVVAGEPTRSWTLESDVSVAVGNSAGPALAACGGGAWLGINDELIGVGGADGGVRRHVVPRAPSYASVDERAPESVRGHSSIQTVACSGDTVAVGRWNAAEAFALDIETGRFTSIALPNEHDAVAAAVSADGVVAFGLQSWNGDGPHKLLLWDPSSGQTELVDVRNSASVRVRTAAAGAVFEIGETGETLQVGSELSDRKLTPGNSSLARPGVDPSTKNVGVMPDGSTVIASAEGLLIETEGGPTTISLGSRACVEPSGPMGPDGPVGAGVAAARNGRCPVQVAALAVDGDGTIWYSPLNSRQVESLTAPGSS